MTEEKCVALSVDFYAQAACRGRYELFVGYNLEGETREIRLRREALARMICLQECPVLEVCREYALAVNEPVGIWGGTTEEERKSLTKGRL